MRIQDVIIKETQESFDSAFKYAKAVPEDKQTWSPLDAGRTVLNVCQELAKCPDWAVSILTPGEAPKFDEESMAANRAEMEGWTTVDICQAEGQKRLANLSEVIGALTDAQLSETKWLPFDGGRDFTLKEMATFPRWNFDYHCGQIAYIQTLYGDKDMH